MEPGVQVGRYRLKSRLGEGGLGQVWRARLSGPEGFERTVALKLVRLDRIDSDKRRAELSTHLINEARLAGRLSHPNVVPVVDFGRDGDLFFAVMELVDGVTLRTLIDRHPHGLPEAVVLELGRQLAAGLAAAHTLTDADGTALGVVHRDIKPSNIMVTPDGTVRILDFGIARSQSNVEQTDPDAPSIRGTPAYLAPEQITGEPLSERTDLFGLGLVLIEAVTGQRLRQATTLPQLVHEITNTDPTGQVAAAATRAPALGGVLRDLLHKRPGERPSDAREVEQRLDALLAGSNGRRALREALDTSGRTPEGALASTLDVGHTDALSTAPGKTVRWRGALGVVAVLVLGAGLATVVGSTVEPAGEREALDSTELQALIAEHQRMQEGGFDELARRRREDVAAECIEHRAGLEEPTKRTCEEVLLQPTLTLAQELERFRFTGDRSEDRAVLRTRLEGARAVADDLARLEQEWPEPTLQLRSAYLEGLIFSRLADSWQAAPVTSQSAPMDLDSMRLLDAERRQDVRSARQRALDALQRVDGDLDAMESDPLYAKVEVLRRRVAGAME